MTLSGQDLAIARPDSSADVLRLAGLLGDDDLIGHDRLNGYSNSRDKKLLERNIRGTSRTRNRPSRLMDAIKRGIAKLPARAGHRRSGADQFSGLSRSVEARSRSRASTRSRIGLRWKSCSRGLAAIAATCRPTNWKRPSRKIAGLKSRSSRPSDTNSQRENVSVWMIAMHSSLRISQRRF